VFRKLLIANRGEIACRIIRTARRLGIACAVVYSEADEGARHVRLADEAWLIGPPPAQRSYLDARAILEAARRSGAEAIHPGYGFLSENEGFASACAAAGIVFVGPPPAAIAAMGEKAAAKERMRRAGVPVLPGYQGEDQALATLERQGHELGFPLIIKPSAGGGGKGMHIVRDRDGLRPALEAARRIARSAFGDERLLLERYLPSARHVEVQVLADTRGRVLHLLDRDCSVQRRHQKLIEEAPAPGLAPPLREALASAACAVAREVGYVGAGTVEMLLEGSEFFFMEMNTRLQVEHPVTEAITGLDLVEWQLRIAAGEPLALSQSDILPRGHAVEARVCAEDPAQGFLPGAGTLHLAAWPDEPTIRVDQGFETGDVVSPHYDSLLGKVVAHADTREEAIARLHASLTRTLIAGVPTNVEWLADALQMPAMRAGPVDTSFVARYGEQLARDAARELAPFAAAARVLASQVATRDASPWALADGFRLGGARPLEIAMRHGEEAITARVLVRGPSLVEVETPEGPLELRRSQGSRRVHPALGTMIELRPRLGGAACRALVTPDRIHLWRDGHHAELTSTDRDADVSVARRPVGSLTAALPGMVVSVHAESGQRVSAGDALVVVEAMKMEHTVRAPQDGVVETVHVRAGDRVREGSTLVTLADEKRHGASVRA
jgi:3-methylcrotonyl-CoA carboxylase alpha subunit